VCSYQWLNVSVPTVSRRSTTYPWRFSSYSVTGLAVWSVRTDPPRPPWSRERVDRRRQTPGSPGSDRSRRPAGAGPGTSSRRPAIRAAPLVQERENHHLGWVDLLIDEIEEEVGKPPEDDPPNLSRDPLVRERRLGDRLQRSKKRRIKVTLKAGDPFRVPAHRIPDLTLDLWTETNGITGHLLGLKPSLHLFPRNGR
jgi:hypothetical protein